jgi:hypothetical protein
MVKTGILTAVSFLLIITMGWIMNSCYWENEESFYSEEICDTIAVTFSGDVRPILENHCFVCHSNVNAQEFGSGVQLQDYEDVSVRSSIILGAIKHLDGFPAMPDNREKLDECLISIVEAWVNQGKPNN